MITKERNVAMNLSIPEGLKKEFTSFAYDLGTNPTNLLKMFMKQAVTTREISFKSSLVKVERFSDKELEDLVGDEEVKEGLLKLNKLLA